tara:strand:+ start:323 stop:925 length:603 start_codon:yes stop_codon:yes gene_type:complete
MKKILLPLLIVSILFGCIDKYSDAKEYIQDIDKCKLVIDNGIILPYLYDVEREFIGLAECNTTPNDSVDYYTKCIKPGLSTDLIKSSDLIKYHLEEIEKITFKNDDMGLKSAIKEQLSYNLNMLNKDFYDLDEHFRCLWTCTVPEDIIVSDMYINKFREKYQKENSLFNKRILDCYKRLADEYRLEISFNEFTGMINVFR